MQSSDNHALMRLVTKLVAAHFGVIPSRARGECPSRHGWAIWPMQVNQYILHRRLSLGASEIGRWTRRTPATVTHNAAAVADRLDTEPPIKAEIDTLAQSILARVIDAGFANPLPI